jgi:hypothetical protein
MEATPPPPQIGALTVPTHKCYTRVEVYLVGNTPAYFYNCKILLVKAVGGEKENSKG